MHHSEPVARSAQDASAPTEEEFRPPSPKYDERTFFMSTQNPWVATRTGVSPNKRSPAVAKRVACGAAWATPPVFNLEDGAATVARAVNRPGGVADASGPVAPNTAGFSNDAGIGNVPVRPAQAADGARSGAAKATILNTDALITPLSSAVKTPPDGGARRADFVQATMPAQKRARLESQACLFPPPLALAHVLAFDAFMQPCMPGQMPENFRALLRCA